MSGTWGVSSICYRNGPDYYQTMGIIRNIASQQDVAEGLCGLTDADLRRLEGIARIRVLGLHELEWQDLLHEAIARTLDGTRQWPIEVDLLVFLRETMRSIASEHWRRKRANPMVSDSHLHTSSEDEDASAFESVVGLAVDPARDAAATEMIARIEEVFKDDHDALHVLRGMTLGKSPSEIQDEGEMNGRRYASTQRRIRRTLARAFPDKGEI